jgi:hypothetical protein
MASISLSFDVRINIIRPFITKNISENDLGRITQNSALKYESLKTNVTQGSLDSGEDTDELSPMDKLDESIKQMDSIYDDFNNLAEMAERDLNKIVFTYDPSLEENELIANAERELFGSASGVITFQKYKKVLAYEQILNREMSEKMVNNGGMLNVG